MTDPQATLEISKSSLHLPLQGFVLKVSSGPDAGLRAGFRQAMHGIVPHVNTLGLVAAEACLRTGEPWRQALLVCAGSRRN